MTATRPAALGAVLAAWLLASASGPAAANERPAPYGFWGPCDARCGGDPLYCLDDAAPPFHWIGESGAAVLTQRGERLAIEPHAVTLDDTALGYEGDDAAPLLINTADGWIAAQDHGAPPLCRLEIAANPVVAGMVRDVALGSDGSGWPVVFVEISAQSPPLPFFTHVITTYVEFPQTGGRSPAQYMIALNDEPFSKVAFAVDGESFAYPLTEKAVLLIVTTDPPDQARLRAAFTAP